MLQSISKNCLTCASRPVQISAATLSCALIVIAALGFNQVLPLHPALSGSLLAAGCVGILWLLYCNYRSEQPPSPKQKQPRKEVYQHLTLSGRNYTTAQDPYKTPETPEEFNVANFMVGVATVGKKDTEDSNDE